MTGVRRMHGRKRPHDPSPDFSYAVRIAVIRDEADLASPPRLAGRSATLAAMMFVLGLIHLVNLLLQVVQIRLHLLHALLGGIRARLRLLCRLLGLLRSRQRLIRCRLCLLNIVRGCTSAYGEGGSKDNQNTSFAENILHPISSSCFTSSGCQPPASYQSKQTNFRLQTVLWKGNER
jgi:hypothetical protein